jgi:hypothetical protein
MSQSEDGVFAELATGLKADQEGIERLKKQKGVNHVGTNEPTNAEWGDGWYSQTTDKVKYLHPNGKWYLAPPSKEVLKTAHDAIAEASKKTVADIDGPVTATPEPETVYGKEAEEIMTDEVEDNEPAEVEVTEEPEWQLNPRQMMPDLRDRILQMYKDRQNPWHKMSEDEQRDVAAAVENMVIDSIQAIAEEIASSGNHAIRCLLESYTEKDGIKVAMKVAAVGDESERAVMFLHNARGGYVMVTKAKIDEYIGDREADIDPDAPEIDFDAEPDPAILSDGDDSDLAGEDDEDDES